MTHTQDEKLSYKTCGVRVDTVHIDTAYERLVHHATSASAAAFHFLNAYTLSLTDANPDYAEIFRTSELNLPDGMPLAWIGRHVYGADITRISGSDFFAHAIARGRADGLRHYLYGSTQEVVAALAHRLVSEFPGSEIADVQSPPFRPLTAEDERELAVRIEGSGANVLWIGLGTPKQDVFARVMTQRANVPVLAVGAAFDFLAGTKKRAPEVLQRVGLEWLHRLYTEPRRLAPRYIKGNVRFVRGVLRGIEVQSCSNG